MKSGVYSITAPSGRQYVGSAVNFVSRWQGHRNRLRRGIHDNAALQAAWNKYGSALRFEKIIICSREQVVMYEQIAIDALNPAMNICRVAGSTLGYKHTDETKSRFGDRKKSYGNLGKKHSAEARRAISVAKTGRTPNREYVTPTDAVREKISATLKAKYRKENHPNFGKKMPADVIKRIADANRGRPNLSVAKPVICCETGVVFPSSMEAARWLASTGKVKNALSSGPYIAAAARGKFPCAYGYTWALLPSNSAIPA